MSTRPLECGSCGRDHASSAPCPKPRSQTKPLVCAFGTPWADHYPPPIGTGRGCGQCATYTPPAVAPKPKRHKPTVGELRQLVAEALDHFTNLQSAVDLRDWVKSAQAALSKKP